MIIGPPLAWLFRGDWDFLNAYVWMIAFVAVLGHMKTERKDVLAARYRRWLASYEADMRRTGKYDRGEAY